MRTLYVVFCLLAIAATIRLSVQIRSAMANRKDAAEVQSLPVEGQGSTFSDQQQVMSTTTALSDEVAVARIAVPGSRSGRMEGEAASSATVRSDSETSAPLKSAGGSLAPARHPAALHESMITPGNFQYLGAFRPPHAQQRGTSFGYGGWGIAYNPDGQPDGPDDGYPGTLFLGGQLSHQKVAEISIPCPVVSRLRSLEALPVAEVLQPFCDVTDGILADFTAGSSEPFRLGGLHVAGRQLHWTMFKYYNVANIDYPSHGTSGLRLQTSIAEGPWHLGPMNSGAPEWHSYKHAGYMFDIPEPESKQWFQGCNLISGLQISTGLQASSQGPAMFAYRIPETAAPANTSLPALPLCWYSEARPIPGHHPADRWTGGAWLTLGSRQAVVIAGRKSLGEFYYGEARPQDCTQDKGYHGTPYEFQILFYAPASLIHAAHGSVPATEVQPWLVWGGTFEGGGPGQYLFSTCSSYVGGLAYDRERNLLYLSQIDAGTTSDNEYEPLPVIHVFRIVE